MLYYIYPRPHFDNNLILALSPNLILILTSEKNWLFLVRPCNWIGFDCFIIPITYFGFSHWVLGDIFQSDYFFSTSLNHFGKKETKLLLSDLFFVEEK
jgi:hypothetical protein